MSLVTSWSRMCGLRLVMCGGVYSGNFSPGLKVGQIVFSEVLSPILSFSVAAALGVDGVVSFVGLRFLGIAPKLGWLSVDLCPKGLCGGGEKLGRGGNVSSEELLRRVDFSCTFLV